MIISIQCNKMVSKGAKRARRTISYRVFSAFIVFTFVFSSIIPPQRVYAQSALNLPTPGSMVGTSASFIPPIVTGITVYPNNSLQFDFIIDTGDDNLQGEALTKESKKLIKYFLASLTVPENEMWVNLSPYEENRIVADGLGNTEMGIDMLAQDYILKQLTASLMYPEDEIGGEFWNRVYSKAQKEYGTTEIPMNTFNKIWIIPDKASVYVNGTSAFVVEGHLKVMLEEDYLALEENLGNTEHGVGTIPEDEVVEISGVTSEVVRNVLIPEIEREVNEGKNFATLRQIFHSMILATWYKKNLKESLLGQIYIDQNKINGVDIEDKDSKQKIYDQYVEAYKKGVYNYIKEDYDGNTQQIIPRKYFSGGKDLTQLASITNEVALSADWLGIQESRNHVQETVRLDGLGASSPVQDAVMLSEDDYLAPTVEQDLVFDQISDQTIVDPETAYSKTYGMVREVFQDILRAADLNPDLYQLYLLNDETPNAFIIPYTTRVQMNIGLLREIASLPRKMQKSVLAFVLAHEITHIQQYRRQVEQGKAPSLTDFKIEEYIKKHIEKYTNEYGADGNALFLINKAGYSVRYAPSLFEKWERENGKRGEVSTPWSSHPKLSQRIVEIKRIMRRHSWRSWKEEQEFPEAVLSELPKESRHLRMVSRAERFTDQRLEERFKHMDDLLKMLDEAPDYESLLFVLQHIYYYTAHFFQKSGFLIDDLYGDYPYRHESYRSTNFTDDTRKAFVEDALIRFLKRAKSLKGETSTVNQSILEQTVVNVFSNKTVFLGAVQVDQGRIYNEAGYEAVNVLDGMGELSTDELASVVAFGHPFAALKVSRTLERDVFVPVLYASEREGTYTSMVDPKERAIDVLSQRIRETGDIDAVREGLRSIRKLYYKFPEGFNKHWVLKHEHKLISEYLAWVEENANFKDHIYQILELYQTLPYNYDLQVPKENFSNIYETIRSTFEGDAEGWEEMINFISRKGNERILHPFQRLSSRRGFSLVATFEDAERNINMLMSLWKIKDKIDFLTDNEGFMKDLDELQNVMGITEGGDRVEFLVMANEIYSPTAYLYLGGDALYSYDHNNIIEQKIFKALLEMPDDERTAYLQDKLADVTDANLNEVSQPLKTLMFLSYFVGPIPLDVFFDEDGKFNPNNYFALTQSEYGSTELPRKGVVTEHLEVEELETFLRFLRGIAGHMNARFKVPLKTDLTVSEEKFEEVEKDGRQLQSLLKDKILAVSTWSEYVQVFSSYVESQRAVEALPSLARSREDNGNNLNLFWGEALGHKATADLVEQLQKRWFDPEKGEEAVYRYSRHAHGRVIQDELEELYDEIPPEKNPDILSWFASIEQSGQSFQQWQERIVANYEPSVFRNYFLYAAFVYKVLKPIADFDTARAFDLRYLKEFFSGLEADKQDDVRQTIIGLNENLTHDWRVEAFNLGIVAFHMSSLKSAVGSADTTSRIKRRNAALRDLQQSEEVLYMTPGGPESQLDLLTALIDEDHLTTELRRSDRTFESKVELLLTSMPRRRNSELDRFLQIILDTTEITLQEAQALLNINQMRDQFASSPVIQQALTGSLNVDDKDDNQSIFHSPLLRDKFAFETLEREFAEQPALFETLESELERIALYFPSFSPMRDGVLKSVVERRVGNPEELAKVQALLMEAQGNIEKDAVRRRIFGRDVVSWLLSKTSLDTRRMFLEWLLGWRMSKPADMVEFENRYLLNLEPLRNQLLQVNDGQIYSGVRSHMIRQFIETAIDSFLENDAITEEFAAQMMQSIVPRGVSGKTFMVYQGVMDAILSSRHQDRKKEILTSLVMEWIDIQLSDEELGIDEIEARMIRVFFQANGFMGVKLAQVLSSTMAFDIPEIIRARLATLKSEAKPIEKGIAITVLDEVIPGGFYSRYKRLIGQPIGSASLGVTFLAEMHDGSIRLVKIKRPEVVVELEEDMQFLSELIEYINPFLSAVDVIIPANLVDTVKTELLKELDFEKEATDTVKLGETLASRKDRKEYNLKAPEIFEVFENMVIEEEYIDGTLSSKEDQLASEGLSLRNIRKRLKHEVLEELFVDGEYHLDPHSDNIIIQNNTSIALIDDNLGTISPELRMPLLAFLMHTYPSRVSRIAVKHMGWDLRKVITELHSGETLSSEVLDGIIRSLETNVIQSKEKSVANRAINAMRLLEENGVVFHEDFGAVRKLFSAADYLLSDIRVTDGPFLVRLVRQVQKKNGITPPTASSPVQGEKAAAMLVGSEKVPGGIDFNPNMLDLQVGGNTNLNFQLDQNSIQYINVNGFTPVIINIAPVTNFTLLLGLAEQDKDQKLSRFP